MSYPTGTILTRIVPEGNALDEIRVVGGDRFNMSVVSNKEFGAPFPLSPEIARKQYTAALPQGSELSAPTYVDPGATPEEKFAAAQRAEPPAPDAGRESIRRQQTEEGDAHPVTERRAKKPAKVKAPVKAGKPNPEPTPNEVANES